MSLIPTASMANETTSYFADPNVVNQLQNILIQLRQQIVLIERYLQALDQAIALEPLPGETSPPAPPGSS